jgi:glucose-6-phosphate 1-dehydrogenase
VLDNHRPVHPYRRHSWGPKAADRLVAAGGGWHNPTPDDSRS